MSGQVSSVGVGESVKAVDERVCISVLKDLKEIHYIFFVVIKRVLAESASKGLRDLLGVIHLIVQT